MNIDVRDETLVFLERDGKIAMGIKTRKTAQGFRNGCGGKRKDGDSFYKCAVDETEEEFSVLVREDGLNLVAFLTITNHGQNGKCTVVRLAVFVARKFEGEPKESAELRNPRWYDKAKLPYEEMMPTDQAWVKLIFEQGKKILVNYQLDPDKKLLGNMWIKPVEELERRHLRWLCRM